MSTPDDYKEFLCEYPFDGWSWCFMIKARSHAEAEERLKQMPWASVKGERVLTIPVGSENLWRRIFKFFHTVIGARG